MSPVVFPGLVKQDLIVRHFGLGCHFSVVTAHSVTQHNCIVHSHCLDPSSVASDSANNCPARPTTPSQNKYWTQSASSGFRIIGTGTATSFFYIPEKGGSKASSRQTSVSFPGGRRNTRHMVGSLRVSGARDGDGGSREASRAALG